jgi:hypothetical protein
MMNSVKYLSKETFHEELSSDEDYENLHDKMARYPQINDLVPNYNLIKMSQTGKYSVSKLDESFITTNEIKKFYNTFINNQTNNPTITDATANAGGNTIIFALNHFNVNSIELSDSEFTRLKNNVKQYNLDNVNLFNGNCIDILFSKKIYQDIVYFDPPWGGTSYKKYKYIGLSLDDKDIGDHIDDLLRQNLCKLVVLKGPYNTFIKNKKYLKFSISVKLRIKKENNTFVKNYYNLYFFSNTNKDIINSHYKNKDSKNVDVNINPFYNNDKTNLYNRLLEISNKYNDKWNIYNSFIVINESLQLLVPQQSSENKEQNTINTINTINKINTIIVKKPLTSTEKLDVIREKFSSSSVICILVSKEHLDVFKQLIENVKNLCDICIFRNKEISINKLYTYILEEIERESNKTILQNRIYFLRNKRVI